MNLLQQLDKTPEREQALRRLRYPGLKQVNGAIERAYDEGAKHGCSVATKFWKWIAFTVGVAGLIGLTAERGHSQANMGPFRTPQMNSTLYVGQTGYPTIQSAVTAACAMSGTAYEISIPPGASPADTATAATGCAKVAIMDRRAAAPIGYVWSGTAYGVVNTIAQSPWRGKNLAVWGDSITAIFGNVWQNGVAARNGMNVVFQDARSGRSMCQAFENYSTASVNLFNVAADLPGNLVSSATGALQGGQGSNYVATPLMDVGGATQFTTNVQIAMFNAATSGYAFYRVDGTYLSGVQTADPGIAANTTQTVPAGARYLRFWINTNFANPATMMVVKGATVPGSYVAYSPPQDSTGHTLAQNLASVDLLMVWLGTNDGLDTLGAPGDLTTTNTFYGCTRNVVETFSIAKPSMRLVMITPYQYNLAAYFGPGGATPAQLAAYVTATQYVAGLSGAPVIDLLHNSGINQFNWPTTLRDGIHPSDAAFQNIIIPILSKAIQPIN